MVACCHGLDGSDMQWDVMVVLFVVLLRCSQHDAAAYSLLPQRSGPVNKQLISFAGWWGQVCCECVQHSPGNMILPGCKRRVGAGQASGLDCSLTWCLLHIRHYPCMQPLQAPAFSPLISLITASPRFCVLLSMLVFHVQFVLSVEALQNECCWVAPAKNMLTLPAWLESEEFHKVTCSCDY